MANYRFAVTALVAIAMPPAPRLLAQDSLPSLMERAGTLRSHRIQEASGVAVSRRNPGILWLHNDSGDKPMVYAVNLAGELQATFAVRGARADDWEDIALAPCPGKTFSCLYIADTGDNSEKRKSVSIYVVPEPAVAGWSPADTLQTEPARQLRITYPGSPHDVEAIYVDSAGEMSLITKGRKGVILRFVISPAAFGQDSAAAVLADTIPITPQRTMGRLITGASISASGSRVVMRTYSELYFFRRNTDGKLRPEGSPCWLGAAEPQGEGVAFLDERTVVLSSESLPSQDGTLLRVRCST